MISTLGVIASFAVYFAFPRLRRYFLYVLPAAIAILAKPTAAIFAVLFAAVSVVLFPEPKRRTERGYSARLAYRGNGPTVCDLRRDAAVRPAHDAAQLDRRRSERAQLPDHAAVRGAALLQNILLADRALRRLRPQSVSHDGRSASSGSASRSSFFSACAAIVAAVFKKTRVIGFGLLWFLIALLPTSLFPLAEVMNDHRTFLPYIGLVIAIAGAAALLVARLDRQPSWTKIAAHVRGRAVPVRKRLRYVSTEQGLENRGNALARRRVKESAQRTRFDELWQHADGERRFRRCARLFPSRPTVHAAVFRAADQSRDCRRCDEAERSSRATF